MKLEFLVEELKEELKCNKLAITVDRKDAKWAKEEFGLGIQNVMENEEGYIFPYIGKGDIEEYLGQMLLEDYFEGFEDEVLMTDNAEMAAAWFNQGREVRLKHDLSKEEKDFQDRLVHCVIIFKMIRVNNIATF